MLFRSLVPLTLLTACGTSTLDPGDTGTTTTTTATHVPACGDGILDPGEACDDGNTWDGDWCSPDCTQILPCAPDPGLLAVTGARTIPAISDYVPWCNAQVLLAERASASIVMFDVAESKEGTAYPLAAEPGSLVLDPLRGYLFVAEPSVPQIERVEIASGTTIAIPLPAAPVALTLGKEGRVFAVMDDPASAPGRQVALIDGAAGVVDGVVTGMFGGLAVYDRAHDQLITGDADTPDGALRSFSYDPQAKTLTLAHELPNIGQDCRDLAISPDGQHVVYLCAGGNVGLDGVADFSTADLSALGVWGSKTDSELHLDPRGAAFTSDGKVLVVVFDDDRWAWLRQATREGTPGVVPGGAVWFRRGVRIAAFPRPEWQLYYLDHHPGSTDLQDLDPFQMFGIEQ